MKTIFISYAKEDKDTALSIYHLFESHGFSPWIDVYHLLPGQDWELEIEKAIHECSIFLACLSRNSVSKRGFVQAEFKKALKVLEMIPDEQAFIIPVRLEDCNVPYRFSKFQWLNYFDDDGPSKLIEAITIYFGFEFNSALNMDNIIIDADKYKFLAKIAQRKGVHERVVESLRVSLNKRKDSCERYWMYITLGEIGGEDAEATVKEGLTDQDEFARLGAEEALRLIEKRKTNNIQFS